MTAEITSEQAALITDLKSYFQVTGAKRFKRTKDEMDRSLTPEKALQERLAEFQGASEQVSSPPGEVSQTQGWLNVIKDMGAEGKQPAKRRRRKRSDGEIVIRIRPSKDADADYFENLPSGEIVIDQDNGFYSWVDTKLLAPYNGDAGQLFQDILDLGLGEVVVQKQFEEDLENGNA